MARSFLSSNSVETLELFYQARRDLLEARFSVACWFCIKLMMSRAVAVINCVLHSLHSVSSIFSSVGSYRKVLRQLMTWELPFRFGQVLLFFWCHCTCLLYSLFKQLSGRDGIAWFLSILDNTVSSSQLGLASDCFERLQVPLVNWPFIFSICQSNVIVFYAWSHRWESLALRCSLSKVC